jgi:phosphoglycerate dehydrogenase-like enzyme
MDRLFDVAMRARLDSLAHIVWARNDIMPPEEVEAQRAEAVAVISPGWRYGDVRTFPKLRAILDVGGGFPTQERLDYAHCFREGIHVLTCAPGFAPAVAELALGMAISVTRRLAFEDAAFRKGSEAWGSWGEVDGFSLFGQTVGMVGFGNIGRELLALLSPFHCTVQVYDPWMTDGYLRSVGVTPVALPTLLETSKVTFVVATPTASNRGMLTRDLLERIPADAAFVLASRSHLVDFEALTDLALAGRFPMAIDVFPEEPLPAEHPIRQADGVLLSPHRAGGGLESYRRIGGMVIDDLEAILNGLPPHRMQAARPEWIALRGF